MSNSSGIQGGSEQRASCSIRACDTPLLVVKLVSFNSLTLRTLVQDRRKGKEKLRKGDDTTSMDYGNGDVAVGQRTIHATRRIRTRDPEESGLTTGR